MKLNTVQICMMFKTFYLIGEYCVGRSSQRWLLLTIGLHISRKAVSWGSSDSFFKCIFISIQAFCSPYHYMLREWSHFDIPIPNYFAAILL